MLVEEKTDSIGRTYYIDKTNGGRISWPAIDIAKKSGLIVVIMKKYI